MLKLTVFVAFVGMLGHDASSSAQPPMPLYVTPYYSSEGPRVAVGEFSEKLAAADAETIVQLADELRSQWETLRAETMFVAAIRLYDLGHKDEAVYWFYSAQYRGRLFAAVLNPAKVGSIGSEAFELRHAYGAFQQLSGEYINGYGFGDLEKLERTLLRVAEEGAALPRLAAAYPDVAFIASDGWAERNEDVRKGLHGLVEHIRANSDLIMEERRRNGIEGKY